MLVPSPHDLGLGPPTCRLMHAVAKPTVNRESVFTIAIGKSVEEWHEVGHRLAPKELWAGIWSRQACSTLRCRESDRTSCRVLGRYELNRFSIRNWVSGSMSTTKRCFLILTSQSLAVGLPT